MEAHAASQLKEIVARHYEIGELVSHERLLLGYINTSYVIETLLAGRRSKYFFRKYKDEIKEVEIQFEHSLINYLIERDFGFVARIINTRDGKTYVRQSQDTTDNGGGADVFYAVFDFLPGEDKEWVNWDCSEEEVKSAAAVFAQFHNTVFDFTPRGTRYEAKIIDLLPVAASDVEKYVKRAGKTGFDAYFLKNSDYILKIANRTFRAINTKEYKEIVPQVIHGDYHPGNLKYQDNKVTGLFDLDWSKIDVRCFDIAQAIHYFCTKWTGNDDADVQLDKAFVFLNTYQNTLKRSPGVGPLSDVELKYLPDMMTASIIYFLNWTIEVFYNSEVDHDEYLTILRYGVCVMRWLENKANRVRLQEMIANLPR